MIGVKRGSTAGVSPHLPPDEENQAEEQAPEVLADPPDDFDAPNVVAGTAAAEDLTEQAPAEPEQQELGIEDSEPEEPEPIREGKMFCEFVRPIFRMDTDGVRYVGHEFAILLTPKHEDNGHLPSEVVREWRHVREGNTKRTEVKSIEPQTIAVGLVPDDKDNDMMLVGAFIEHPILAEVEVKGKGATNKMIRFTFRAFLEQTPKHAKFATDHYGDPVWISMQRTQGSLLEAG